MVWIVFAVVMAVGIGLSVLIAAGSTKSRSSGVTWAVGLVILLGVMTFYCSWAPVDKGHVGVVSFAGKIQLESYLTEGAHFVPPWVDVTLFEAYKRHYVSVGDATNMETVVCSDDKQVEVQLTFGFSISAEHAPRLLRHFQPEQLDRMASTAARSATRSVFIGVEAMKVYGGKANIVDDLQREFEERLSAQLHGLEAFAGLTPDQLKGVFSVLPVQAENILPPLRVRTAMNENQAANVELERQTTLKQVAVQVALRMGEKGKGLKNLISELPANTPLGEAANLVRSAAEYKRAEAIEQAIQDGKISVIYLEGQAGGANATVPASLPVASGAVAATDAK